MIARCAAPFCRTSLTDDEAVHCEHGVTFCRLELAEDCCQECEATA